MPDDDADDTLAYELVAVVVYIFAFVAAVDAGDVAAAISSTNRTREFPHVLFRIATF